MTSERRPGQQLSELRVQRLPIRNVLPLSQLRVGRTNCINTGSMSFFNLVLATLERCPVPPLSELRIPSLSERRVRPANCI